MRCALQPQDWGKNQFINLPCAHIAKRQQDCSLPVTVVVRSEAGLLRISGCSRAACQSVVLEQVGERCSRAVVEQTCSRVVVEQHCSGVVVRQPCYQECSTSWCFPMLSVTTLFTRCYEAKFRLFSNILGNS